MPDVIATTEHGLESGERQAERDLGAIINEVEHLTAQLAEHTTSIEGMKEDRQWIRERLEALERDLIAIPRVPEELARTVSESIPQMMTRLEQLEATTTDEDDEPQTRAPHRDESTSEERENGHTPARRSWLDDVF